MTFARRVFLIAGIYGVVVILPQYFLEGRLSHDYPPAITIRSTSMASSAWRWRGSSCSCLSPATSTAIVP